jgi:hypothetical protein
MRLGNRFPTRLRNAPEHLEVVEHPGLKAEPADLIRDYNINLFGQTNLKRVSFDKGHAIFKAIAAAKASGDLDHPTAFDRVDPTGASLARQKAQDTRPRAKIKHNVT